MRIKIPNVKGIEYINGWKLGDQRNILISQFDGPFNEMVDYYFNSLIVPNNDNLPELTLIDKLQILIQCRLIINSPVIHINFICEKCKNRSEAVVDLSNIKVTGTGEGEILLNGKIVKLNYQGNIVKSINISQDELDNLSLEDYKIVEEKFNEISQDIEIHSEKKCILCHNTSPLIFDKDYIINNLIIDMDLPVYYKSAFAMKTGMGLSLQEFENLAPFELEVYSNMYADYIKEK